MPDYNINQTSAGSPALEQYIPGFDVEFDLDGIWEYIAADNIDAADSWIEKLFHAFDALGKTPGMGHKREDLTSYPVLFWPVGAYLVIYRAECLTQGSRDIPPFRASGRATETANLDSRVTKILLSQNRPPEH